MDILVLLEKMEDIIEEASKFPLSNKIMIEKEELLEIINEIRLKMPEEINRASWVAKERQRILSEAQTEADELLEKAKSQQNNIVDESEIVRIAKQRAEDILKDAEQKASEMKAGAYTYSDKMLSELQEKVVQINNIIEENRQVLKSM